MQEMGAYRLYTVVPYLVKFLDSLTNVYVRYNRKRMKGSGGKEDSLMALASLYNVLLEVCKVGFSASSGLLHQLIFRILPIAVIAWGMEWGILSWYPLSLFRPLVIPPLLGTLL